MRLLMTTDTVGGVWTYCQELVHGAMRRSLEVMLVTVGPEPDGEQSAWLREMASTWRGDFRFAHVSGPLEWMEEGSTAYEQTSGAMIALCAEFAPDLVHCNQFGYGALPVKRRDGRPVPKLIAAHSDVLSWWRARYGERMPESAWRRAYVTQVERGLAGADVIVTPTAAVHHDLTASFDFGTPVRVLWNGRTTESARLSDAEVFAGKQLQAMTCGRLWDEGKNASLLERVPALPMPVMIAGATRNAEARIDAGTDFGGNIGASRGAAGKVNYAGRLGSEALRRLMLESAVYVVTSRYEPFGLAAVEAALCGCAVVASDIASQREIWGESAVFFGSDDANALQRQLERLARDPQQLRRVAERCRHHARTRLSGERMVEETIALYGELISWREASAGQERGRTERVA